MNTLGDVRRRLRMHYPGVSVFGGDGDGGKINEVRRDVGAA